MQDQKSASETQVVGDSSQQTSNQSNGQMKAFKVFQSGKLIAHWTEDKGFLVKDGQQVEEETPPPPKVMSAKEFIETWEKYPEFRGGKAEVIRKKPSSQQKKPKGE